MVFARLRFLVLATVTALFVINALGETQTTEGRGDPNLMPAEPPPVGSDSSRCAYLYVAEHDEVIDARILIPLPGPDTESDTEIRQFPNQHQVFDHCHPLDSRNRYNIMIPTKGDR
jgi:hypothetical protein